MTKTQRTRPHSPLGIASVMLVTAVSSNAVGQVEAINVAYDAPASCPDGTRFKAEIAARTHNVSFANTPDARRFRAVIRDEGSAFTGELAANVDGSEGELRRVRDLQCSDVASALALMIAIDIDPHASTAPASALIMPERSVAKAPAVREPQALPPTLAPVAPISPHSHRWSLWAGVDATVISGVAPDASLGGALFVEGRRHGANTSAVRLSLGYANSAPLGGSSRDATVDWLGARLEGCPLTAALTTAVRLSPCLGFEAARLRAEGVGAPIPKTNSAWTVAASLGARFTWNAGKSVFLGAAGAAQFPIVRQTFVFEHPLVVVYEMPAVGWAGSLGAGLRFL